MPLTARETVAMETPARLATSRMLMAPGRRLPGALLLELVIAKLLYDFPLLLNRIRDSKNSRNDCEGWLFVSSLEARQVETERGIPAMLSRYGKRFPLN
jgi:hypothetical protein